MINVYHQLLPRVLEIIRAFASQDEKKACDLFEILEELIEYAIAVVTPLVKLIIEMCLHLGSDSSIPMAVQIKAINVVGKFLVRFLRVRSNWEIIGWLIRAKGKVVQKNKLIEPIIDVLIRLMAQQPDDEGNEEYFLGDPDQFTSITVATQTLDMIAMNVPADKVVPYLLTKIEPAIQGECIFIPPI